VLPQARTRWGEEGVLMVEGGSRPESEKAE